MFGPNDRRIWYFNPDIRAAMPRWHQPATKEDCADGTCDCRPRPQLTYMAQKEGQWRRGSTYGGELTENGTQAVSRETLEPPKAALEKYGYPIILSVYDELVAEPPKNFGSPEEFEDIMLSNLPVFARDWPIRADCWEGDRYKK